MSIALPILQPSGAPQPAICGPCGGECCKRAPGISHPDDWNPSNPTEMFALLVDALQTNWVADGWDGWCQEREIFGPADTEFDPPRAGTDDWLWYHTDYVRPRGANDRSITSRSWGAGQCVFLTDSGCGLSYADRPTQCRELIPAEDRDCKLSDPNLGKRGLAQAWAPYQLLLNSAIAEARRTINEPS